MHLNDALGDGKPQAGPALLAGDGVVRLLELLKQLGLIGSGDTRSQLKTAVRGITPTTDIWGFAIPP